MSMRLPSRSRQGSRVRFLILLLVVALATTFLPAASAYFAMRDEVADIRVDSGQLIALMRLSFDAGRLAVEYIDIAVLGEDREELDEFLAATQADLAVLRVSNSRHRLKDAEVVDVDLLVSQVQGLQERGEALLEAAGAGGPSEEIS